MEYKVPNAGRIELSCCQAVEKQTLYIVALFLDAAGNWTVSFSVVYWSAMCPVCLFIYFLYSQSKTLLQLVQLFVCTLCILKGYADVFFTHSDTITDPKGTVQLRK